MRTIWKFTLDVRDVSFVSIPGDSKILCAQTQDGAITLWADVDPEGVTGERKFYIYETGHEHKKLIGKYIGTCQVGKFVWHVYDGGWDA